MCALYAGTVRSGRVGDEVFLKTGIVRKWVMPKNSQTARKVQSTESFAFASALWLFVVEQGGEVSWNEYAANTVRLNRLAQQKLRTGRDWFIAINQFLINAGQPTELTAPTTPGFAAPWSYTVTAINMVAMTIENVLGVSTVGDVFQIQVSAPWTVTKNTFNGRTTTTIIGTDADIDGLVIRPLGEVTTGSVFFVVGTRLDSTGKIQVNKNVVRTVVVA